MLCWKQGVGIAAAFFIAERLRTILLALSLIVLVKVGLVVLTGAAG